MVAVDSNLMTALDGSGCGGGGGGGLFRVEYFKIPRQVDVEICVYLKKLYFREGLGGLIFLSLVYAHCTSYLTPCTDY